MKLIIAGSRTLEQCGSLISVAIHYFGLTPTEVVCGGAKGVDESGAAWALRNGTVVHDMPAKWDKHGKAAGPIRNKAMAKYADCLLLIWDGESRGSANMRYEMIAAGKPFHEVVLRSHTNEVRKKA